MKSGRSANGRRLLAGTAVVAAALALGVVAGPAHQPVPVAQVTAAPTAPAAGAVPLQEFRTPGNAGWFYTLNPTEASKATSQFKFTKSADIGKLYPTGGPGRVAIHRLRAKNGGPSYMLSISPAELHNPAFVDEGILGYADGGQKPGQLRLMRFSNHGKWRALADGPANINNMKAEGYTVDGPLGWFQP